MARTGANVFLTWRELELLRGVREEAVELLREDDEDHGGGTADGATADELEAIPLPIPHLSLRRENA